MERSFRVAAHHAASGSEGSPLISRPERRVEGRAKVTGRAGFVADLRPPGLLHVAFARSPLPHARVVRVQTEAAGAMPGVRAILTGADVRPRSLGRRLQDWPLLAWDTVRFVGDPVAAVAADSLPEAEAAAALVGVEYEELPAVFDPEEAIRPNAPILHPNAAGYRYLGGDRPPTDHPNVQGHVHHEHGDVDGAFGAAAHVFEHTFHVAKTFHGHLEPHASIVEFQAGRYTIRSTNKSPFRLRDHLESSLDIPPEQLVIDAGYIGGDFGGKGFSVDDFVLTLLARQTGRPVRSVPRFSDDLRATNTRHAAVIQMRTGVDASGRIVAHETRTIFDGGAYAAGKANINLVPGGSLHVMPGYQVPNARIDVTCVYTNTVPGGHARAPGQPQNTFAAESHIDLIARALAIDPLELRHRNAIRPGGIDILGRTWAHSSMPQVIETLARDSLWTRPRTVGRGRGMAIGARSSPSGPTQATLVLSVLPTGQLEVLVPIPDQGGGAHTMIQRVVAQTLAIPPEWITVRRGTTAETARDLGVGGSRVTPVVGGAAASGARLLAERLDHLAPGRARPAQLDRARAMGGVSVIGSYEHPAGVFSTYGCKVEVDVDAETGNVRILDVLFVADVGTVINPMSLRGQLVGGIVAGLGQAIMEEVRYEEGTMTTANLGEYKLPTSLDVPPIRVELIDGGDGGGPFGAKSAAELGNVPIGPAVANAIEDAVGHRIRSLPITAEKVYEALADTARHAGPGVPSEAERARGALIEGGYADTGSA